MRQKTQIIQFHPEYALASQPYTLTPLQPSNANWREFLSVALDDLATLVSPKRIIYCEGKDIPGSSGKEKGLDAQVYNTIFSRQDPDTFFISSGGNTELDQRSAVAISILGKVFPDVEILILKDRDFASGQLTTEKDRQLYFQNNPSLHRVLKRWEIENYLFDKEVLTVYCKNNNQIFDEAAYDIHITDIVNQDVKSEIGKVKNFCHLKGSINSEKFKLVLAQTVTPEMQVYRELHDVIFNRG
jgi:hypothetical protein